MSVKPKPPTRSGFCGESWPLDTDWGRASHARCRMDGCACECGHGPAVPREPLRWTGDDS